MDAQYGSCATCGRGDVLLRAAGPRTGQLTLHDGPAGACCPSAGFDATPPSGPGHAPHSPIEIKRRSACRIAKALREQGLSNISLAVQLAKRGDAAARNALVQRLGLPPSTTPGYLRKHLMDADWPAVDALLVGLASGAVPPDKITLRPGQIAFLCRSYLGFGSGEIVEVLDKGGAPQLALRLDRGNPGWTVDTPMTDVALIRDLSLDAAACAWWTSRGERWDGSPTHLQYILGEWAKAGQPA